MHGGAQEDSREGKHGHGGLVLTAKILGGERGRGDGRSGGASNSLAPLKSLEPAAKRVKQTLGS